MKIFNVEEIKILQRLLNPADLQALLNRWGFNVPLQTIIEERIKDLFPVGNKILGSYIALNYDWFIHAPAEDVTKKINQYMLTDPECFEILGYRFCYDNTVQSNYKLLMNAGIILALILAVKYAS